MNFISLEDEYRKNTPLYERLCKELVTQIRELCQQADIKGIVLVEHRVKPWKSIINKCERQQISPQTITEINDLAGIRIILLFRRDLPKVCSLIEVNFMVLNKEDTQERLGSSEFGYGSIHYEITPPDSWLEVPTLKLLKGLRAELQVRTASQHVWAAASHILQYKKESDVPIPIRRTVNRVAALLETVDLEFERVLDDRLAYINHIQSDGCLNEVLNTDSLRQLLDEMLPPENKLSDEPYAALLDDLAFFNIRRINELRDILNKWVDVLKEEEQKNLSRCKAEIAEWGRPSGSTHERQSRGVFYTHVGWTRTALGLEFNVYLTALGWQFRKK